ncbi:hypothetical protein VNO77_00623 [Canavalia gladiata]|uniref:Uncharacterized protein n=1 Tax=Canavalia gladiata TaxID=3824 RepID=A0AAN9R1H6_CANGL
MSDQTPRSRNSILHLSSSSELSHIILPSCLCIADKSLILLSAMGIGNSKLNSGDGNAVPPKIRPVLTGRLEDFKKRRNGEGALSKKQLLNETDEEDGISHSSQETETEDKVSSKEIKSPKKEEMVVRSTPTTEKLSRVVPMPNVECEIGENNTNKGNVEQANKDVDPNKDKVVHIVKMDEADVKTEQGKAAEPVEEPKKENYQAPAKGDDNTDDNDSDDDDERGKFNGFLCPGSPSFRIYCIEADKRKEEECDNPTIMVHQKSLSAESVRGTASRDLNEVIQDVEIESTTKRKGNKKKFGAVKTLLKVKSCYHPIRTCTGDRGTIVTGDDRGTIVTAKAAK